MAVGSASANVPQPPPPMLPAPYEELRLGMSLEELTRIFPPAGSLSSCTVRLVGERSDGPSTAGKEEKKEERERSSDCATSTQVSGITREELFTTLGFFVDEDKGDAANEKMMGWMMTLAQVRGALRAGVITEEQLRASLPDPATDAGRTAAMAAAVLFDGSMKFVRPRQARRPIAAAVAEDCSGIDPERARQYVQGKFSLDQLDQQARLRVANGKCRGAYTLHEGAMQRGFVGRTGGLAGIGLARSTRADRALQVDVPSTYAVYSLRSGLTPGAARLGVLIANGLDATEKFWSGAIALRVSEPGALGTAFVWLEQGKVSRILVNLSEEKRISALREALIKLHGEPGQASDALMRWSAAGGAVLALDQGAIKALRIGEVSAAAPAAP